MHPLERKTWAFRKILRLLEHVPLCNTYVTKHPRCGAREAEASTIFKACSNFLQQYFENCHCQQGL